ncbi:hsp40 co-chaperone [Grosmannia clavigera kw1407]|uniref:Hsp40 co-chaperone n=1 Tax=Grosmannia clavigera (strain kw1407 / UAMH 11150) TaxID=655863 RepID=F0XG30_GROCL|nr:hsp40 co-chaperone [Grosmannia clavigera kw1407]EFX03345.1 hsp40 co-chaperone [Grosmannia clavigera kw1407]
MFVRFTAAPACPCCSVHCIFSSSLYSSASARRPRFYLAPRPQRQPFATAVRDDGVGHNQQSSRSAQSRHKHGQRGGNALFWPTSTNPTPYEIFNQAREAPYQKAQFYQLVKLYHPDRHRHVAGPGYKHGHGQDHGHGYGLSASTMLERYRLIVAANEILSNPAKRRAYDLYGVGWAGHTAAHTSYRSADQSWRSRPGSAANNATWEDWEQWHNERSGNSRGEKQVTQFMSNGGFAVIVIFFIVLGGIAQVTRAGSTSLTMLEMQDQQHEKISRKLLDQETGHAPLSREDRVWTFLERREGWYNLSSSPSLPPTRQPDDSRSGK